MNLPKEPLQVPSDFGTRKRAYQIKGNPKTT